VTRLALEGGFFPPAYRPVSEGELARLFRAVQRQRTGVSGSAESRRLAWLVARYESGRAGLAIDGCSCRRHPWHLRFSGRAVGGYSGLGDLIDAEGGLAFTAGHNVFWEPAAELSVGAFWAAVNVRFGGRVAAGGVDFTGAGGDADPLTWPGWSRPTGRADVRDVRLDDGHWRGQLTRAVIGASWGRWALSAGWDQRRTGPALSGDLNLDYRGRPFAALTARRTQAFVWSGAMRYLAPDETLLRVGKLSRRQVTFHDVYGTHAISATPWFMQWLLGWNITPWFRTHFTQTVVATSRGGTLWPDVLQINFPLVGTTWREGDSGPITDRIFSAQFEFRWRRAPWPLLPAAAGRLYWDYGGTDFLPSGPGGLIPQISVPASLVGLELVSPRWDLGFEYAELQHETVLWYSNAGYAEGYSHEQTLMGHPFGGSAEGLTGLVRVRPARAGYQLSFEGRRLRWGMRGHTPGTGQRRTVALRLQRSPVTPADPRQPSRAASGGRWELSVEWNREQADRLAFVTRAAVDQAVHRDWWRIIVKVGI